VEIISGIIGLIARSKGCCVSTISSRRESKPMSKARSETDPIMLPAGVLRPDFCIIDEQPDHLVLTVRVPKATILKHHLMLLALSEAVSETAPRDRA
jgi:hypothetical protein